MSGPPPRLPTFLDAVRAFGEGFSATRSLTSPFEFVESGRLFLMRDAVDRGTRARASEVIVADLPPSEAIDEIGRTSLGRFFLCVIHPPHADEVAVKAAYKAAGFRLLRREAFFACPLSAIAPEEPTPVVEAVCDLATLEELRTLERRRLMPEEDLGNPDPQFRIFLSRSQGIPVGWVRSLRALPGVTWVAGLYVRPEHRRQGYGRALMQAMLQDDARLGYRHSVLLATSVGARLYPRVGYERIGTLLFFAPPKQVTAARS